MEESKAEGFLLDKAGLANTDGTNGEEEAEVQHEDEGVHMRMGKRRSTRMMTPPLTRSIFGFVESIMANWG